MPASPAENKLINDENLDTLWQEFSKPVVFVSNNPRYVNFWTTICGDGMNFVSILATGGKKFGSPWAMLGFKGLLKALIVSEAEPDDGDLEVLEMQEALEDYVVRHGLHAQAKAASRLASRLPWLAKNKFVDAMPQPLHSTDLLRGYVARSGSLPNVDVTFKYPPRFMIGILLIAGHLMETRFNHWMWNNIDLDAASTSLAAAYRQLFYLWEMGSRTSDSPWDVPSMKEVYEVGEFLGHLRYSQRGDLKFRDPGLNTSYWEAAIVGPTSGTAADAVLSAQQPNTKVVGGTVLSVSAGWFAKIRASDLFGERVFDRPYNDFPFPMDKIPATCLSDTERRLAYAQKDLPSFELIQFHFGRRRPISPFQQLWLNPAPSFPPLSAIRTGGRFRNTYLSQIEIAAGTRSDAEDMNSGAPFATESHGANAVCENGGGKHGWKSIYLPVHGDIVPVAEGNDSGLRAFVDALRASGTAANLEDVKDLARNQGWDEDSFANCGDLGRLCHRFEVGLILDSELTGSIQYLGPNDAHLIRLVYLENKQFGWVREKSEKAKVDSKQKGVHFHDTS